jgi:hypothetical protein
MQMTKGSTKWLLTDLHCGLLSVRQSVVPSSWEYALGRKCVESNGYTWYCTAILVTQIAPYEASASNFPLPSVLSCSCLMSCSKLSLTSAG